MKFKHLDSFRGGGCPLVNNDRQWVHCGDSRSAQCWEEEVTWRLCEDCV